VPSDVSPNVQAERGAKAARGAGPVTHHRGLRPSCCLSLAEQALRWPCPRALAVPARRTQCDAGCKRRRRPRRTPAGCLAGDPWAGASRV